MGIISPMKACPGENYSDRSHPCCWARLPVLVVRVFRLLPLPIPLAQPHPDASPLSPWAVIVNGEGISQAEFEAELARYQQADEALGLSPIRK